MPIYNWGVTIIDATLAFIYYVAGFKSLKLVILSPICKLCDEASVITFSSEKFVQLNCSKLPAVCMLY